MSVKTQGQEPAAETAQPGATDQAAEQDSTSDKKTELEAKIEAAKGNPELLQALVGDLFGELKTTRKEAGDHRVSKKDLEKQLQAFKEKETERERSELSELERTKLEKKDLEDRLAAVESRASNAEAKSAFATAGATDIDSVVLHWNALSTEEKGKTTPDKFAAKLKTDKPWLFSGTQKNSGSNPRGDQVEKDLEEKSFKLRGKTPADKRALNKAWKEI